MDSPTTTTVETLMTVRQLAQQTGYSKWFIYQEISHGRLAGVRAGKNRRSIRIAPSDWARYMAEHRTHLQ